jgi:DNA-binding HxlR family transcriptional regulator
MSRSLDRRSKPARQRPAALRKRAPPDPWNAACPSRALIERLASKWVLLLMPLLRAGPHRNGALMRSAQGISQKVLTETLRGLEHSGLVQRRDYREVPPRVEYSLTPLGSSLALAITALDDWVIRNYDEVADASRRLRS